MNKTGAHEVNRTAAHLIQLRGEGGAVDTIDKLRVESKNTDHCRSIRQFFAQVADEMERLYERLDTHTRPGPARDSHREQCST